MSPDEARRETFRRLEDEGVDLLVVGGGVTGAGVARDAALRGLRVGLVDKQDWASGTSSRSSKLVHGGIRYLQSFQFGLVLESIRERERQRRLNPNLVWPIPMLRPVYRGDRPGPLVIRAGLWLYDLMAAFRSYRRHRRLSRAAVLERVPGIRPDGLRAGLLFYDCRTDDARLVLANVLDAERRGARVANYARLERLRFDDQGVASAEVEDVQQGTRHLVPTRHVVFAVGHWSDHVDRGASDGAVMRPTKGVHVVVARERLPTDVAVGMTAPGDGRITFAVPFGPAVYIGTTDTDHAGDLDEVHATPEDVAYLLDTANAYFPEARLTSADVRSTWAGLRPLLRDDAQSAYRTSREHHLFKDPRGVTTIAGGKLTTYRAMAEEVTDIAARDLARRFRVQSSRCRTHTTPLDPELEPVEDPVAGLDDPLEDTLWRLHGGGAAWIRSRMATHPDEGARLCDATPAVMAQVSRAVLFEHARTLEDVLVRRLPVFYLAGDQGLAAAPAVARHMATLLERAPGWIEEQLTAYRDRVAASRACLTPPPA